ncbi:hypothetical protein PTSG_08898 [Salpingoeca rosetta]|uniref:Thioredoxin domain-containing protein n=1 Tax=Salpingoeca rosetta (strain ATCC 50818 / BSB-021) TaxID=946362 RepID=F2UL09_SALR5|nr:uncharacterized protein PTSG_08898 [Salpingoeca rosetta]EGD77808.1 hypothetical protein PTSG_08898 [Salpingoeca rosetta]|eukprot:XP_004990284.1 hypothetical protein PTSG_08898 [Salpingoeca rosetta]
MKALAAVAVAVLVAVAVVSRPVAADKAVTNLNDKNFNEFVNEYEVVLVNFYANWCRFSQMLKPIYEQAALLLGDSVNARLGSVDCESPDAQQQKTLNAISKYPTIKVYRNGRPLRQEYRGQRSAVAIEKFVRELLAPPVTQATSEDDIKKFVEKHHKAVVGYFPAKDAASYPSFEQLAQLLRDDCHFIAKLGEQPRLVMKTKADEHAFEGDMTDGDQLLQWAKDECTPLVREITFQNGEELTEEGLPFIILFYDPNNMHAVQQFSRVVRAHFEEYRGRINFITADGHKFTHPLQHLGKTKKDLPVLAADTFRHMYLFKNFKRIHQVEVFKKFIDDVLTGRLHYELHNPSQKTTPDPYADKYDDYADEEEPGNYLAAGKKETIKEKVAEAEELKRARRAAPTAAGGDGGEREAAAEPEEGGDEDHRPVAVKSVMGRLRPSDNRYSILKHRDEL